MQLNGVAWLNDRYLNTSTRLSLTSVNNINFSVVNVPGSYAADRFWIQFTATITAANTPIAEKNSQTSRIAQAKIVTPVANTAADITIYPNPVVNKMVKISHHALRLNGKPSQH